MQNTKTSPLLRPTYAFLLVFTLGVWSTFYSLSDEVIRSSRWGTLPKGLLPSLAYCAIGLAYGLFKDWRLSSIKARQSANKILLLSRKGGFLIKISALVTLIMLPLIAARHLDMVDAVSFRQFTQYLFPVLMVTALAFVGLNYRWIVSFNLLTNKKKFKEKYYPQAIFLAVSAFALAICSAIPYLNILRKPAFTTLTCWVIPTFLVATLGQILALIRYWRRNKPKKPRKARPVSGKPTSFGKYPLGHR